jgi:HAD superfamily hydrolase (TIGR01509 family)
MIKAIFWDNDGVLVDTERLYFEATRDVLASAGVELTEEQYIQFFLVEGRGAWHLAEALGAAEVDRLKDARNRLYSQRLAEQSRLIPGVTDVLEALHGRYVMGVVTSSRKDHFDVIHRSTGLMKYFDFVLALGDYARAKPEPDPYARAVERSGLPPEACMAIEDSERGLESATRAGIRCIIVPSGLTRGCQFDGAHHVVSSVADIPALL